MSMILMDKTNGRHTVMTVYQSLSLMIMFTVLCITIINANKR
ncbi:putative holin-like toxin [Lacticaseibacillus pantheris]